LNILVVGEADSWFDQTVTASLVDMGHHVSVFHYGHVVGEYYPRGRWSEREKKNRDLLSKVEKLKVEEGLDLIFCYVYDDFLLSEAASALRALRVPMVNYNVDMTNQWYRQIRTARYFTAMLCAQRVHMNDLARYGAPTYFFPMASRVPRFMDDQRLAISAPVTFVGTPMRYRIALLAALIDAGIPLAVYGKFWKEGLIASPDRNLQKTLNDIRAYGFARLRAEGMGAISSALAWRIGGFRQARKLKKIKPSLHGYLPNEAIPVLFRDSKINLGLTRMVRDNPLKQGITQMKLRDFEVPACGGFYLVEHTSEYCELFAPSREVETWRTVGELIEKIRYYVDHESERVAIAVAGQRRALRDHLWTHRFSDLFAKLGIA
jgi:hypothetical protein